MIGNAHAAQRGRLDHEATHAHIHIAPLHLSRCRASLMLRIVQANLDHEVSRRPNHRYDAEARARLEPTCWFTSCRPPQLRSPTVCASSTSCAMPSATTAFNRNGRLHLPLAVDVDRQVAGEGAQPQVSLEVVSLFLRGEGCKHGPSVENLLPRCRHTAGPADGCSCRRDRMPSHRVPFNFAQRSLALHGRPSTPTAALRRSPKSSASAARDARAMHDRSLD